MIWLAAALLMQAQDPDPQAILRQALRAVEQDSASQAEQQWRRAGPDHRPALLGLGSLARLRYEYARSDSLLDRAIGDQRDAYADHARLERATSEVTRGNLRAASGWYRAALEGAEQRGDAMLAAQALIGLAGPQSRLGTPQEALRLLERAGRLAGDDRRLWPVLFCQRAMLLTRLGNRASRALAEEGAAQARAAGDRRQEGRCYQAMAQQLSAEGDIDGAIGYINRAAPLLRQSHDHASLASLLQWKGFLYNQLLWYGKARETLIEAVELGQQARAMSAVGWASINLGMVSLGLGDLSGARPQFERAMRMLELQGDTWGVVTARSMLAGVARAAGDLPRARAGYDSVLQWAERVGQWQTQYNMHEALSSIDLLAGAWDSAAFRLGRSRSLAQRYSMPGRVYSLTLNEGRLALYRGDLPRAERLLRRALGERDSSSMVQHAIRVYLAETLARSGRIDEAETEMITAANELDRWRASLSDRYLRLHAVEFDYGVDPDLGVATVLAMLADAGRAEIAFALAERRRARELADRMQRVQAFDTAGAPQAAETAWRTTGLDGSDSLVLDDSTALLEFVAGRGGEPTTLFIRTSRGLTSRGLEPIDSLAEPVRRWRAVVEGGGDARPLATRLGSALLAPALPALAGIRRLIIVPADVLARLPFDALLLPEGGYAIERFAISTAPSARVLAMIRARPDDDRPLRLLALADPRFTDGREETGSETVIYRSAFDATGGLPRLAASAAEARLVARFSPLSEVRLRERAGEAWLRTAPLDSFRIIHFATHALVDEEAGVRTALALSPGDGHDGFLGQADLAALSLRADLVVLSACRTAGGLVLRGEGVQGLTAPLLQAGARSIVATGWPVADHRVAPLMQGFYRGLAAGLPATEALRAAKLEQLRAGVPASEWAAFTLVGDPATTLRLIEPDPDPTWLQLGVLAALIAAGLAIYSWRRKRVGRATSWEPSRRVARTDHR